MAILGGLKMEVRVAGEEWYGGGQRIGGEGDDI